MHFVDTNYFLRLIIRDVPEQYQSAKKLFQRAALGEIKLFTSTLAIFEVYWVMSSFYRSNKSPIINSLAKILDMDYIHLGERDLLRQTFNVFIERNLSLVDCYNLVYAKTSHSKGIFTFDIKLDKEYRKDKPQK